MKWKTVEDKANELRIQYPAFRYGQSIFNALYMLDSETADQIRGTRLDCFHNDTLVPLFKLEVLNLWKVREL